MNRREFILSGHRLRYYETGDGPPLLLVHGAGGTGKIWAGLMRRLSGNFRCIAPDLPGFGGSEFYDGCAGPEGYAEFLAALIPALGIEKTSVAGSSLGGRAACILAARHKEMVEKLVLFSLSGIVETPAKRLESFIGKAYEGSHDMAKRERVLTTIRELQGRGGLGPLDDDVLAGIATPTHIIWGEDDDVIPPAQAGLYGNAIADSRIITINGAGHLPWLDKLEEAANIMLKIKINQY